MSIIIDDVAGQAMSAKVFESPLGGDYAALPIRFAQAGMDDLVADLEGTALSIYAAADLDPEEPPSAHELAEALMGRGRVQYARGILGAGKYQRLPDGREWIFLRPGLPELNEELTLFHELAERHFWGREQSEQIEEWCDQLAYRLRMPRPAFRSLVKHVGPDWRKLAAPWGASETAGAMRYLEVTGTPGLVITPQTIRARGEQFAWPDENEIRRLVRVRSLPNGIERHRISDRRGSVVLVAV
jgi:hypothetical protein